MCEFCDEQDDGYEDPYDEEDYEEGGAFYDGHRPSGNCDECGGGECERYEVS